jgi:ElaB/YqjD/DUF883 family membrane-anchored ribosome-binding protein
MTETSGSDETPATARQAIRDGIDDAYAKASQAAHSAVERTKDGLEQAKGKVNDAYASGREKAAEGFDSNPLAVLLGGIAIGAALGALLPRTEREAKALGAVGEKVRGAAGEAIEAAKGAGRDKLDELGLSREHARETMKSLLDGAIAAAGSAGAAAIDSARKKSGD